VKYFLDIAEAVAKKSKDPNTQVGAVIVTDNRVQSTGYNGYAMGAADDKLPKCAPEKYDYFIHAEVNALLAAVKNGIQINHNTIVYLTHSPCPNCIRLLWQAGIKNFVANYLHKSSELYKNMLDLHIDVIKHNGTYSITSRVKC